MGALTQKSHTLIVIDEKAVISGVELVLKERPEGRSVFVFTCPPEITKKMRTEEGPAFGSLVGMAGYLDIPLVGVGYYYKRVTF
jgi:hypothetical protein